MAPKAAQKCSMGISVELATAGTRPESVKDASLAHLRNQDLLIAKFKELDVNGDGRLSFDELKVLLQKGNPLMSDADIQILFDNIDEGKRGFIIFEDFVNYIYEPSDGADCTNFDASQVAPLSPTHVNMLQVQFPFQGYIPIAEHRGITVPQLRSVVRFAANHCGKWHDTAASQYSSTSGNSLSMSFLNLYHMSAWVIKPATMRSDSAFVELLTCESQAPKWFISHWWGEAVQDFLMCVERHSSLRELHGDDPYWVCAYANRQHSLEEDLTYDPRSSSFYKAMQLAIGVLLILDDTKTGPATAFKRIWCDFEESIAIQNPALLLDIVASHHGEVELLTDGVVPSDELYFLGALEAKSDRENSFPLEIIKQGLNVEIQKGQASVPADRRRILNSIACRSVDCLDEEPFEEHDMYEKVNCQLRSVFAIAMIPQAAQNNLIQEFNLLNIIAGDRWRQELALHLQHSKEIRTCARELSECIASMVHLKRLEVNLSKSDVDCLAEVSKCVGGLDDLQHVQFDFSGTMVRDCVGLFRETASHQNIEHLFLNFDGTHVDIVPELDNQETRFSKLKYFALRLWNTPISNVSNLGKIVSRMTELQHLKLYLHSTLLCGVMDLGIGSAQLISLRHFDLNLANTKVDEIRQLSMAIKTFVQLQHLSLDMFRTNVSDVEELGKSLVNLTELRYLMFGFYGTKLSEITRLGKSLRKLRKLNVFILFLGETHVANTEDLGTSIASLEHIQTLRLGLSDTQVSNITTLGRCIATLKPLQHFLLNLEQSLVDHVVRKHFSDLEVFRDAFRKLEQSFGRSVKRSK